MSPYPKQIQDSTPPAPPSSEPRKGLRLLTIEFNEAAYRFDFAFYVTVTVALAVFLGVQAPASLSVEIAGYTFAGLLAWTAIEYAIHRLILHGLKPFSIWHGEHHRRPTALIGAPTFVTAGLITAVVFVPAWLATDLWRGLALTLGVLIGYNAYIVTHHAAHHWRPDNPWIRRRKIWHALHHGSLQQGSHYGVTSGFWDYVFGTTRHRPPR
jgi:cyclopropane-fatty-acyl-phospholipid synthase